MSGIRSLTRNPTVKGAASGASAPIYVDSDDNIVKVIPAGSGTTEVQIVDVSSVQTLTNKTIASSAGTPFVGGVAAGYKLARGSQALDGANPTPVVTGLATVVAFVVTLANAAAPGIGTSILTRGTVAAGTVDVNAWKVTSAIDATLIASAGTETFDWVAIGT